MTSPHQVEPNFSMDNLIRSNTSMDGRSSKNQPPYMADGPPRHKSETHLYIDSFVSFSGCDRRSKICSWYARHCLNLRVRLSCPATHLALWIMICTPATSSSTVISCKPVNMHFSTCSLPLCFTMTYAIHFKWLKVGELLLSTYIATFQGAPVVLEIPLFYLQF